MTAPTPTAPTDWRDLGAGIALDVLVATRVLGLVYERVVTGGVTYHEVRAPGEEHPTFLPAYSSNVCDAWQVVEALRVRGDVPHIMYVRALETWRANFRRDNADGEWGFTAALAICKAALAAVEAS
jgi:hypothetical protein